MMRELRDLEEDRQRAELYDSVPEIQQIALAALDEIDRLKRLLVWRNPITGKWSARIDCHTSSGAYATEADAWAEVRKAAFQKGPNNEVSK